MIIEFQLIGEKRKELAKTISEIIGAPAEYQFMPTCAYKIGDFYTVTKEGNLEISDSADSKEIDMLISELASRGYDVPLDEEENGLTVEMPLELVDDATIDRLRKIVENKGELFKLETSDNPKYTMRCYLLRLGMIGVEYKSTRKVLLRNLSGSSAFRKVANNEVSE